MSIRLKSLLITLAFIATADLASAQQFEIVGTRAAGMGGAFVAVADDSSATYWNPAGLALGHMFSLVVDRKVTDLEPESLDDPTRHDRASLLTLGVPALGLTHYQLRTTSVTPVGTKLFQFPQAGDTPVRMVRLDKLTAYHTGVTLVQSIVQGVAVGTTLKVVHGDVASSIVPDGNRDERLDNAADLATEGTNKFDADIGVMAGGGRLKLGFAVRNVTEPSFTITGTSDIMRLKRQMRAGVAVSVAEGWSIASDFDLTENGPVEAPVRSWAAGTEGRLTRQIFVRSGFHVNTTGKARPSVSAGGSYAVRSAMFIDGQATWGGENADRGWGIATRIVY
jgi:F plasmid transfer operon protein TraF